MEARRSVWDLRCHLLENGSLVSALTEIMKPLAPNGQVKTEVKISGEPTRLQGAVEMNLLRIGQEAVANAIKHGQARHVRVELNYGSRRVRLSISGDGPGVSPGEVARGGQGGLRGGPERMQSIGFPPKIES